MKIWESVNLKTNNVLEKIFINQRDKKMENLAMSIKQFGGSKVLLAYVGGSIKANGIYDAVVHKLNKEGTDSQVRGHIQGNLKVGNDREILNGITTQLLPYIGYPRILNALNAINEITLKQ